MRSHLPIWKVLVLYSKEVGMIISYSTNLIRFLRGFQLITVIWLRYMKPHTSPNVPVSGLVLLIGLLISYLYLCNAVPWAGFLPKYLVTSSGRIYTLVLTYSGRSLYWTYVNSILYAKSNYWPFLTILLARSAFAYQNSKKVRGITLSLFFLA